MSNKVAKVPVIMQMEALECGAACLAMVLAYHGKWIPLETVREDCGVSRDGSNLKSILQAARNYGLKTAGYKCGLEAVKTIKFPAIIHWNFNHFVVLNGFKGNYAILNDPARGTVKVEMKEFDESFTGVVLTLEKGEAFKPGGKPKSVMAFAMSRLKGTLVPFLFVVITGLLTTLIGIIQPGFGRVFQDRLLTQRNPEWLYPFILGFAALVIFQLTISIINTIYMLKIQGKLAIVANSGFMWHVLRLPIKFFSQRMIGDIVSRQGSNEGIASMLIGQFAPIALQLGMLVFYLAMMFKFSLMLSFVGIVTVFLNMFVANQITKKRINLTRVQMRDAGKAASCTMSGIEMIETIKASGAENGYFERWSGFQASVNSVSVKFTKINQYLGAVPGIISSIANTVVFMLGVMLIMTNDDWSIGKLGMFQGFLGSFMSPVQSLIGVMQGVQEMRTSMERVEDVMTYKTDVEYKPVAEQSETKEYTKLKGKLELKNLTFGYNPLGEPLIENFNLTLEPGSRVAFVGFSGCGKSTLAKLISGLYQPWSGEILFDGVSISDLDRDVLTSSLSVVDQDIVVFEDTVAGNIKMWDESVEDFEMILAARDAQIHEDIMVREGGYNYPLIEGGKNFSGGQKQRLEIARVLAKDPSIIVLDEATSALDAKTEFDVTKSIIDRGITCVVVAHRLSTIKDCDEIVVMDNGKVIERGTHEQLYKSDGLYTKLITTA
ncbi:MAG: NHLP family bacteriocin export ABC transporter peptidase/permease/ATPase subunit [Oscillospiraceae bacterium]|jgi:NHLM bacteriocin system ABC transporter peptidase/ATP-binding protein|nr:NHLP family bacteriocin export ABC transporter peptidase/permease/ATPase subunit [Oscillospiraceae bacterium]